MPSDKQYITREDADEKMQPVEDAIRTLNREMGMVLGELIWIRRIMAGVFMTLIAIVIRSFSI